ncbi:MAG: ribonuclease H [bacterium]|nr:ribonuclease H [bacterium]
MDKIIIFTDGSSRGNPGKGGWGAIISSSDLVEEVGGREDDTTNNRMEISAAVNALRSSIVSDDKNSGIQIQIYTDSAYLINGITKWIFGWLKNGWKKVNSEDIKNEEDKNILNRDLWEKLYSLTKGKKIEWIKVDGHSGVSANERCDEIATTFADEEPTKLFKGLKSEYKINLNFVADINSSESVDKFFTDSVKKSSSKKSSKNSRKALYYLSLVNGVFYKDITWEECEKRVKGKKGVKYKKITSLDEESETRKQWTA